MIKDLPISIPPNDLRLNTGALYSKYEQQIISAFRWVESTQKSYRNTMNSASEFLTGISFCDCMTDDFDMAIEKLNKRRIAGGKNPYSENTLKGFRSVFNDLCYFSETYSNGRYSSVVWGSDWKIADGSKNSQKQPEEEEKERVKRQVALPRSLTMTQELKLVDAINRYIEKDSNYAGLALSFYLGLRPGECCGVTFSDIRPLEGYPGAYCLYIYEQLKVDEIASNDLKTPNAYRVLPIPLELFQLLSRRKAAVERKMRGNCDSCYIVCLDDTRSGLWRQGNRRSFRVFAQNILRSIKVDEQVVINLSKEIKAKTASESNVTTYLLRRNFATALSGVCGIEDDELKYLMGHAIGAADEKRHDFVNPDALFQLWEKLNLRTFQSNHDSTIAIGSRQQPLLLRQKAAKISVDSAAIGEAGIYLRVFNEFPNDYIRVVAQSDKAAGVMYRTALEPSELKKIGRVKIHGEFAEAVQKARNRLK